MNRNPCRDCQEVGENEDKRNPTCMACIKRIEYVRQFGDMTCSVPEHLTTYGSKNKIDPGEGKIMTEQTTEAETVHHFPRFKKCKVCGDRFEVNSDNFQKHWKTADGFTDTCKKCHGEKISMRMRGAKKPEEKAQGAAVQVKSGKDIIVENEDRLKSPIGDRKLMILLDFTGRDALREKLDQLSHQEMRSPENQALYIIHQFFWNMEPKCKQ